MLKNFISNIQDSFSKTASYTNYNVKETLPFRDLIKGIDKENIQQQTQQAEYVFLKANWDVKAELLLINTADIPFLESCDAFYDQSFLIKLLLGELYINKAWEIRGDDYADNVSKNQWNHFETYIEKGITTLNACLHIKPNLAIAYQCLMTAFVGIGDTDTVLELFDKAIEYNPNNIYVYSDMMWAISPRWHCHENASINDMRNFMLHHLDTLPSFNKYYLWLYYLQECEIEMEEQDYENYINDAKVREFTNIIINDFETDPSLSYFNIHFANRLLLTAYELSIENKKLLDIANDVLPNNISLTVWNDYADTPKEVYKLIKTVIKLNTK